MQGGVGPLLKKLANQVQGLFTDLLLTHQAYGVHLEKMLLEVIPVPQVQFVKIMPNTMK